MQLMHMRKSAQAWKNFQNETRAIPCFTTLFSRAGIQYALDRHNSKPNVGIERDGMKLDTLKTLYINELRDLYNAENQLVKALPKMAKAASSEELKDAFEKHLNQTETHVERLEEVFDDIGEKAKGRTCHGMKGLIEEGSEILHEQGDESVIDAGIIVAAQNGEHYE